MGPHIAAISLYSCCHVRNQPERAIFAEGSADNGVGDSGRMGVIDLGVAAVVEKVDLVLAVEYAAEELSGTISATIPASLSGIGNVSAFDSPLVERSIIQ